MYKKTAVKTLSDSLAINKIVLGRSACRMN